MRSQLLPALLALVSLLPAGCISTEPDKFKSQVREWVPVGTEVTEARRIMERHRFTCYLITTNHQLNVLGRDYLDCERLQFSFHDWHVRLLVDDEKISGYGPLTIE